MEWIYLSLAIAAGIVLGGCVLVGLLFVVNELSKRMKRYEP